jgi:competence protein ComEC
MSAMPLAAEQTSGDSGEMPRGSPPRTPVAAVTLSLIAGILADRWLQVNTAAWAAIALVGVLLVWLAPRRSLRIVTFSLLLGCACVGGLRHQLSWSVVAGDDISRLVESEPILVRVIGIVESPIVILSADESAMTPEWMQVDRSMCDLRCESLAVEDGQHPVTGTIRLLASGHLLHVDIGDRIEVMGRLSSPREPSNPGGFDYRQYLRRQGVLAVIDCNHPDAVRLQTPRVAGRFQRWRSQLRQECERTFAAHLDERTAPLASSLLLGERSHLPTDVRDAFVQSGTMHLLAISGLHVGILAGLLLLGCRLLNFSVGLTTIVILLGVAAFVCVTNLRPPVVRASVLAVVVAAGWPMYRFAGTANLIAVCGLVVLLIDPTDLFDTGTQLSFLAVMAIGWSADFISRRRFSIDEESLLPRLFRRRAGVLGLVRFLAEGYVVTTAIWLFTLPLTMAQFHIAAPVGFVINVLLIPWVTVVLGLGFLTMAVGLLLPGIAAAPAYLFDKALQGLLVVVDAASALDLGHAHLAGPSIAWLGVFYALLATVLLLGRWVAVRRWGWSVVWGWVIVGQLAALLPSEREALACTVLDVGHGCCVVLQLPDGETLLYDSGMLASEERGRQIIPSALWELGVRRIDGIIISHADVDHFNAVAGLMETMPVGTLLCSRTFLDFSQEAVEAACNAAQDADVRIKLLHAGDRLALKAGQINLQVMHPPDGWRSDEDNPNSIVLAIEFGGRTILLTGDLEREGLDRLMATDFVGDDDIDVLLAPHHGSRLANPRSFAEWGQPKVVIVSGGNARTGDLLRTIYDSAERLHTTYDSGAVSVEVGPDGSLQVTPYLDYSDRPGRTPM